MSEIVVDIVSVERLGCSVNGNPTYNVHTSSGTFRTSSDAAVSYSLPNITGRSNTVGTDGFTLTLTRAGRVTDAYKLIDGKKVRP